MNRASFFNKSCTVTYLFYSFGMLTWLKNQKEQIISPVLDWVQIEVSTRCNATCIYCPHTLASKSWQSSHFPLTFFYDLLPSLGHTKLVFLQGWGEPLLHPELFEMVRLCKNRNKMVGFTTNGMLLNKKTIHVIVDLQVDILGISFAGTTSSTHNRIRKGTDFDTVVMALDYLRRIKAERRTTKPAVHLAYLMLASNFEELSGIPRLAEKVGAEQVVASNLTMILDPQLSREALFNNPQRLDEYNRTLARIKKEAAGQRKRILFEYQGPGLDKSSFSCPENVCRACVINVAGEVGPCVFTNTILSGSSSKTATKKIMPIFKNRPIPLETFSFGNIKNNSLTRIWQSKKYREFRNIFDPDTKLSARQISAEMPTSCRTCYKRMLSS